MQDSRTDFDLLNTRTAMATIAMISLESAHDVPTTIDRLDSILTEKGFAVFGRVDHAANAERVGMQLRPTQLLIFGNPQIGTKLIMNSPGIAVDLPLKMIASEDEAGKVNLSWIDPQHLKTAHQVEECDELFINMANVLEVFARQAVAP